jgi:peptidoglycan-associated lipoprotein
MSRIPTRYVIAALLVFAAACGKKPPAAPPPAAPPQVFPGTPPPVTPPAPPTRVDPPVTARDPQVTSTAADPYAGKAPDDINKDSPLKPVFFKYDSDQLDDAARQTLTEDAEVLKKYSNWVITIEGHCDERGTAEYNLALGDRRALAARGFLITLGINADRLRTVSYGKEFPFDAAHSESAYEKNRRAHFTVTATAESR